MNENNREYPLPKAPAFDFSEEHEGSAKVATDLPTGKSARETMDEMNEVSRQLREVLKKATKRPKA